MLRVLFFIGFVLITLSAFSQSYEKLIQNGDFKGASNIANQPIQYFQCAVEMSRWKLADSLKKQQNIKEQDPNFPLYSMLLGRLFIKQKKI